MMTHNRLQGSVTISRPRGDDTDYIEIAAFDKLSGTEFVTLRIAPADFAEALVGLAHVECSFDLRPERVGKQYQHKEEIVPYDGGYVHVNERALVAAGVLTPFETDGWKGRIDDLFNPHRRTGNTQRVVFTRYVPQPPATPAEGE